ncbi:AAA family ATPase [Endozoicomonas arenosclerae]|uniref:AAA family ATPase n=1 Tax=Endozoicomonas arenosclerae TaxID=1633495 RepID=UPI0007831FE9|nr:AAA family ATPase [Endozoicomonas arenosclerae]
MSLVSVENQAANQKAMDELTGILSEQARREELAVEPEIISDDHTVEDTEIPPHGVGKPCVDGISKFMSFKALTIGFNINVNYIIKNYLPAESFGVIYGASESFKSFHTVAWAAAIASGKAWNGASVRKSPVLYVAAEGGLGAARRGRGWELQYNQGDQLENLYAVQQPVFMGSNEQVAALANTVSMIERQTGEKVSTIFLDTLARCFGGADENRTADMNLFVAGCDKLKSLTGATIVVVHHTGKNKEKDARGSSALRAACDFEYCIERPSKGMYYTLSCTKVKDSEPPKTQAFDMSIKHLFNDQDGDAVTTLVPTVEGREPPVEEPEEKAIRLTGNHEAVLQAVRSRMASGESTVRSVIRDDLKAQGLNTKHFPRWVDKLLNDELVSLSGEELKLICKS